jgi:anion-transporting  ArsA/GET3 family ATPase
MSTTLAGSQEFTALERLLQAYESDKFDLVVLDTPPTKHALDFLSAPQRINSLFQDAVTKWFMDPNEKSQGFIAGLVGRGTRTLIKYLETLTGEQFIQELVDFFNAIRSIQKVLRERSQKIEQILTGPEARFAVVTSFDAAKLKEALYLRGELVKHGYRLQAVVINRAFPLGVPPEINSAPPEVDKELYARVLDFFKRFKEYHSIRYTYYDEFARSLDPSITIVRVPEYQRDIYGVSDLQALAKVLSE